MFAMYDDNLILKFLFYFTFFVGVKSLLYYYYQNLKSPILIIKSILSDYFQPENNLPLKERFGNWAVITGSTDGIGKEYAKGLAKKGINIILISRSENKLIETAKEIEKTYFVKTKWIVADFSQGQSIYEHIKKELIGIRVGILVNNVGQMYDYPQELSDVPQDKVWNMIAVNIGATAMMSKLLIDHMKKNGKGAIVNLGSITQECPGPYFALYAAGKSFIKYLTIALQTELEPYNITVQLLKPSFIATKLTYFNSYLRQDNLVVADVKSFAESAIFTLGKSDETTGTINHGIQTAICALVPERISVYIGSKIAKYWERQYLREKSVLE